MDKKKTLEDIFNDDEFGILDSTKQNSNLKTEDERLIESFQEINVFFENNNREPEATNVSEFKLLSRLKALRKDESKVEILKSYDAHNLLNTKVEVKSVVDILNDDDLGILDTDEALSIFKLQHVKSASERAETDFTAQRKAMNDKQFEPYQSMFKTVHKELKEGKRSLSLYAKAGSNLEKGSYYILNGMLLFLEEASIEAENVTLPSGNRLRKDGRTRIIFENGTVSNMKYRSLDKALLHKDNDGRIVSHTITEIENKLFDTVNSVNEEDSESGWIYILQSKSSDTKISSIQNLYKIGFSTVPVQERVKNASKEATYLFADVIIVSGFKCYNMNTHKFEQLIHRFFSDVCLNVDVFDDKGKRITPREWFVAPLPLIEQAIDLLITGEILNYKYDSSSMALVKK
jgi:hypothetical protein